jgi:hypothetical protein
VRKRPLAGTEAPARYDVTYTTAVGTPHVKWADPYVNGPIRPFIVSSVHEGRTVSELMQRLTLEPRVVSIDPRWDVNKWCVDRYPAFDGLVPRDYSISYGVLGAELAADRRYDVLVMHSMRGWNDLPEEIKEAIRTRVRRGEGLVFVHPHLGEDETAQDLWELVPIVRVAPVRMEAPGAGIDEGYPKPPQHALSGMAWRQAADHYIPNGIPFEALPYPALQHYRYELAEGAEALVTGVDRAPVVAVKEYGMGRVVGLGYHNYALFPELTGKRGELNENFWEYLFGLLMRSIIWAARKEPPVQLRAVSPPAKRLAPEVGGVVTLRLSNAGQPQPVRLSAAFRDAFRTVVSETTKTVRLRAGETLVLLPVPEKPAGGRHFVDVMVSAGGVKQDWGTGSYEVVRQAQVTKVTLEAEAVAAGKALTGTARVRGDGRGLTLSAELWDLLGRLLDVRRLPVGTKKHVSFRLTCPEALTHVGWVRCRLLDGDRYVHEGRAEVVLTAPRRKWEDYEVILPWLHDGLWPWTDALESQYRRAGITSTSDVRYNFPLTLSMHPPGFGVYWYRRHGYVRRREEYGRTKNKRLLWRAPCFHSDEFRKPVAAALRKGIPPILKYSPLAYFIADESSVTCYEDAFDLCWSTATLAEFRRWLRRRYRTLNALNAEWGTRYRSWDTAKPVTWEEAQQRGNPAPWVDHRLFMNRSLVGAFEYACSVARKIDPEGMVTISGTQLPGSHNGCDWWQMDRIIEYLQPYSVGGQDEMHRSFNPDMLLTGFTGYSQSGAPLEHEIWHRLLHGHCGASIFWGYTFVDPDLALNAQGRSFEKVFGELRGEGLSRTVNGLTRVHDGVALHYSMASGHVWWIQDGKLEYEALEPGLRSSPSFRRFINNRVAWCQLLEDTGYQYNYLAYTRLEEGGLKRDGYRALILPGSIALSDREVEQIRAFVEGGGLLIADVMPGTTDLHGKPLPQSPLHDLFTEGGSGRGRAVCAHQWAEPYLQARSGPDGQSARQTLVSELQSAGIEPQARVSGADGGHPLGIERVSWSGGGMEVVALLKELRGIQRETADGTSAFEVQEGMAETDRVRVTGPRGHWYDLRAHQHLGERSETRAVVKEADPKFYAVLPYRVAGLSLTRSGGRRPGDMVRYEVAIDTSGAKAARHVVKIEVFAPDGEKQSAYSRNIDTRGGAGSGRFRLALNDLTGTWRIVATDVISGASAEATWEVG